MRRLLAIIFIAILAASTLGVIAASAAPFVSSDGWGWQNPLPHGQYISAIWSDSPCHAYAVGPDGYIWLIDGDEMTPMDSGTVDSLMGVWGSSSGDVFAVGGPGTIIHYDGTGWSSMYSGTSQYLFNIGGTSSSNVFAVGDGGTILHYNGTAWSTMDSGTTQWLNDVSFSSDTDGWAVGSYGTILHYDGTEWNSVSSPTANTLTSVCGLSEDDGWIVGDAGTILRWDGAVWNTVSSGTTNRLNDVWVETDEWDTSGGWVVGQQSTILHLEAEGGVTPASSESAPSDLNSVHGSSGSDVYAVGSAGTVLHYDGTDWNAVSTAITTALCSAAWGSSGSDIFVVGDLGTTLHYNGTVWSSMDSGTTQWLTGVWGSSGSDIFAVGKGGAILHYNGTAWSAMTSGTALDLLDIWGSSGSDVYAVGNMGTILHYNGFAWSAVDSGTTNNLMAIDGGFGSYFAVGANGTLLHYDGEDLTSIDSGTTKTFYGIWCNSDTDVFAVGQTRTVLHYDGSDWSPMTVTDIPFWVWLNDVWGSSGSNVYAVGAYGAILTYDGIDWSGVDSGTTNTLDAVWGSSESDIYTFGVDGTVLHFPEYLPPVLEGIDPVVGMRGAEDLSVTIMGQNLDNVEDVGDVSFGSGITVDSLDEVISTEITVRITIASDATLGPRDISVTVPTGTDTLENAFTVQVGELELFEVVPAEVEQGYDGAIHIYGQNLDDPTEVDLGSGVTVNDCTEVDSTEMICQITVDEEAELGLRDVTVTTSHGIATLTDGFTIVEDDTPTGSGCGCSNNTASTDKIASGWGIVGLLGVVGFSLHKKRKR